MANGMLLLRFLKDASFLFHLYLFSGVMFYTYYWDLLSVQVTMAVLFANCFFQYEIYFFLID